MQRVGCSSISRSDLMQSHVCGLGRGPVLTLQFHNVATPAALGDPGNLAATLAGKHQAVPEAALSLPASQSHLVDLAKQSRSHLSTVPILNHLRRGHEMHKGRITDWLLSLFSSSAPGLSSQPDLTTAAAADSRQQTKAHLTIPIPDTAAGFSGVSQSEKSCRPF